MVDTSTWDNKISELIEELYDTNYTNLLISEKANKLSSIESRLSNVLFDFGASIDFSNLDTWEHWIIEYNRISSKIDNLSNEINTMTESLVNKKVDKELAIDLLKKFLVKNGFSLNNGSYVRDNNIITLTSDINDRYIDTIIETVKG